MRFKIFNKMKIITTIGILLIAMVTTFGQVDQERMDRDLKVAENVIATLLEQDENSFFGRSPVRGSYVEDYGVIFWANNSVSRYRIRGYGSAATLFEVQGSRSSRTVIAKSDKKGDMIKKINVDSLRDSKTEEWIDKMKTFLVDYGDLIGQLKPSDKIMITTYPDNRSGEWLVEAQALTIINDKEASGGVSLEITKADLQSQKQGNLSRQQLMDKIVVVKAEEAVEVAQDVELLASIFERLYRPDLSDTYYVTGKIQYKQVPNFGIIYKFRVYSSVLDNNGLYSIRTLSLNDVEKKERDEKVASMYPAFVEQLKQNIANYGRTLTSPDDNEVIMFDINLTECVECGIPDKIELSMKSSDLKALASGKLTDKQFMDKISLKEIGKQ